MKVQAVPRISSPCPFPQRFQKLVRYFHFLPWWKSYFHSWNNLNKKFHKSKIFFWITKFFCYANKRCFCRISEGVCWSLIVLLDVYIARRSNSKVSRILSSHYFTIFGINSTTSFGIIISIFSVFWEFVWRRYWFTAWNRFSNHINSVNTINLVDLNDYKPDLMFCIWHVQ